jgi:hypothetical protein
MKPETYIATRWIDGKETAVTFSARDLTDAEDHCDNCGYRLEGRLNCSVPHDHRVTQEIVESMCELMNHKRQGH